MTEQDNWNVVRQSARCAIELEAAKQQRDDLLAFCVELQPMLYGMLCKTWGHPDNWPTYGAQGVILYERLRNLIANEERA